MYLARIIEVEGSIPNWDNLIVSGGFIHSLECGMSSWTSQLEFLLSSNWKWVLVLNHLNDNEFDLHENTSFISIWMVCTRTRFETEVNSTSEMGYCLTLMEPAIWFAAIIWMLCTEPDIMTSMDSSVSFVRKSLWCLSSDIWHDNVTSSFTPV